jgi:hypothetical protein
MVKLTLIFIIILTNNLYSQTDLVAKKQVRRIIKLGLSSRSGHDDTWFACNDDSLYFKSDTIRFYNSGNYFYKFEHCCQFVEWQFFKRNVIQRQESQWCKEPPCTFVASLISFKYKILKRKNKLILKTYRKDNCTVSFIIIGIENVIFPSGQQDGQRIILKRLKTNYR